ncbi:MAG: preprotein translocase subunit SecY [Archaeoglobaceae archaeon]|nr:preprotein translocase subunit SecY [Archaeoglobaceae archaeon]MCX8151442.1 preprotein translocase subunit SecY [Archaeoglobaceae archaeon]MDW8014204.1 preprotein translocase subunit SecY [Archaeoglobaceae archaeon]
MKNFRTYVERLPSVEKPKRHVHFREKFLWTSVILLLYFFLCNVPIFGLSPESIDIFAAYRALFAGASGSILALGIAPIVTAGIVLQLLVGAGIIKLDLTNPEDRATYQQLQRLLVILMILVEAAAQIGGRMLLPDKNLAEVLGVSLSVISFLIFVQLVIGGFLIVYMDEVVSKWGIGSGVSLFILASVSQAIMVGLFNWITPPNSELPAGIFPRLFYIATNYPADFLLSGDGLIYLMVEGGILALITTIFIIILVIFFEGTRIEVPLAHAAVRGVRARFPIKLIYASVLPMIFVRAFQITIVSFGAMLYYRGITIFGDYVEGVPVSGIMFYLSPINGPHDWVPSLFKARGAAFAAVPDWAILLHLILDATILILGGIIFSIFWVQTSGMDARTVASQIARSGLRIPGFRKNPIVLERLFERYIPKTTVIGGALIGFLTLVASMLGTVGGVGGTGLLLAVSISYRFYEQLLREQVAEMHPLIRRMLGESV